MGSSLVFQSASRGRFLFLLVLALILAASTSTDQSRTLAYFISTATNPGNTLATVTLNISTTPSGSSFFSLSNMVPGDYSLNAVTIANGGTNANQNFTYTMSSTASPTSLLDSTVPSGTATSGGAFLLLRCTSDAAGALPLACGTTNVYITQVYPTAGAGTQVKITTAGGLVAGQVGPVSTAGVTFTVTAGGTAFTGGQLAIGAPFNMGGPDAVTGADGQVKGLIFGHSDYLASIVYLPTQMGNTLAGLTSTLGFTWTGEQRAGIAR
jgi:hypothetical protein